MLNFIINHFEVFISLFALLISFLTYKRNRLKYQYQFAADCRSPDSIVLVDGDDILETKSYTDSVITNLHFINLSNFDIGFFELKAYDNTNNRYLNMLTVNSISFDEQYKQPLELITISDKEARKRHLQLPNFKYGSFKAKSMTYFDIVVFPYENTESITIEFELPKQRFLSAIQKNIHQKFVKCGVNYNINGWKDSKTVKPNCK
ncbi:hypothetical protein MTQ94_06420 [Staphylococcus agnetis]|uniref:Uncharacterized protein n=2 Tax=Staphylococcus TaxID=1279 RepID=A0A418JI07_STAHY|nr:MULTISPECIES: hypothetical protein [Staphylococcus]MCO4339732.1 hypothetical protein [Staphylococcus agnetis]MCO4341430.1 hypothetical protein [Staphylococcus agnetis]MCO4343417.1 hypothetical protein [Staphylococcus agnetis]MCO4348493.1 hypothetical protein [Staphylococcus agnetis]MCO4353440.1 hypothetical protein [Staphylococcus agnetis]